MRNLIRLGLLAGLAGGSLSAATITYSVTNLNAVNGSNQPLYRYIYNLIGVPLAVNQELDIVFEITRFAAGSLTNGVYNGSPNLTLSLFQIGNPIGANGHYNLYASPGVPSMLGTFSVDFAYTGVGTPGDQAYTVTQFDSQGINPLSQVTSGFTTASGVPEPSTIVLGAVGLAWIAFARSRRK